MRYLLLALALLQSPTTAILDRIEADLAELRKVLTVPDPDPTVTIYFVPAGENLDQALGFVPDGGIVELEQCAVYAGTTTTRKPVTLRTQGWAPPPVDVCLAKLTPPSQQAAVIVEAPRVTLQGVEVVGNCNDCILFRPSATDWLLEWVYIHGDPVLGAKRGVTLNGSGILRDSVITDIFRVGQESQGIGGWEGGPYRIERNLIEAASINMLVGGSDPSSEAAHPHDLTVIGNTFRKKIEWRGRGYAVKNLFELKMMRRATITDNVLEYSWVDGQLGWGAVFSIRNQSGGAPYAIIEDVAFERNTIRHVAGGISILGQDDIHPSQRLRNLTIRQNVIEDINRTTWGTNGRAIQIARGSENLILDGNTVRGGNVHSFLFFTSGTAFPNVGFQLLNHTATEGRWGIFGDGNVGFGQTALNVYAPGAIWTNVTLERNPASYQPQPYPAGTTIVTP